MDDHNDDKTPYAVGYAALLAILMLAGIVLCALAWAGWGMG